VRQDVAVEFEVWERTAELRWMPRDNSHAPRFKLEQAWRNPDGKVEWREVPKVLYGGDPDTGR
jgi:hypothetical protein